MIKKYVSLQQTLALYTYQASTVGDVIGDTRTSNQSGWYYLETCTVANAAKGAGTWVITKAMLTKSLTDSNEGEGAGTYVDLVSGKSGRGSIICGDNVGFAEFTFTTAGVVTLLMVSDNVFTSLQTGTNHIVIKDNGTNVRITNELGSTTTFTIEIKYTN
jgi:hypothetical protein